MNALVLPRRKPPRPPPRVEVDLVTAALEAPLPPPLPLLLRPPRPPLPRPLELGSFAGDSLSTTIMAVEGGHVYF